MNIGFNIHVCIVKVSESEVIKPLNQDKTHICDAASNTENRQEGTLHIHSTPIFPDVFSIAIKFLNNNPADILKCTGSRVGITRLLRQLIK